MTQGRILVACIGNIFLGDDAFGCEVANFLRDRRLGDDVKLVDFGIRGFDLAYALMEPYEAIVFVDATPRGGDPGTLYVIEPDREELDAIDPASGAVEPHGMDPMKVIAFAKGMGASPEKIVVVGCEPEFTGEDGEGHMGLSAAVAASVPRAAEIVDGLVNKLLERPAMPAAIIEQGVMA